MKKLVTVVVILAIIWAVPPLRDRAGSAALPVLERLGPVADFAVNPIRRYSASNDLSHFVGVIGTDAELGRQPPEARSFATWVRSRMPGETGRDPWGNDYWMATGSGIPRLGSNGPDGVRDTDDDITTQVTP